MDSRDQAGVKAQLLNPWGQLILVEIQISKDKGCLEAKFNNREPALYTQLQNQLMQMLV